MRTNYNNPIDTNFENISAFLNPEFLLADEDHSQFDLLAGQIEELENKLHQTNALVQKQKGDSILFLKHKLRFMNQEFIALNNDFERISYYEKNNRERQILLLKARAYDFSVKIDALFSIYSR